MTPEAALTHARRVRPLAFLVMCVAIAGCGGERRTAGSGAAISGWTEAEREDTRQDSRRIDGEGAPPPATESRTLGGAPARGVVRRGPTVDVAFVGAPLREVMRMLADAAGLQLVIADDLDATVDVELRDVRPLDAMGAIAEAHGAHVVVRGDVVIVER